MSIDKRNEGPIARAWRAIAENVEKNGGSYQRAATTFSFGLCRAARDYGLFRTETERERVSQFDNGHGYYWPLTCQTAPDRGRREDRILAAWFIYWQCREEGV